MSRPAAEDALARFLAAESARPEDGAEGAVELTEGAEEALFALFAALPELAPPAGFAERTLARAGVGALETLGAVAARGRRWAPWQRGLVLAALAGVAWSASWAPAVLKALGHLVSPVGLINAANGAATAMILGLSEVLELGQRILVLGMVVSHPFKTPTAAWVGAACLGASWLAFRSLRDLLSRQRSWAHVEPV